MDQTQIANWIALAALAFTVVVGGLGLAFRLGGLSRDLQNHTARIKDLEDGEAAQGRGRTALEVALAELRGAIVTEMNHMREGFSELKREMLWLRKGALYEIDRVDPPAPSPTPPARKR